MTKLPSRRLIGRTTILCFLVLVSPGLTAAQSPRTILVVDESTIDQAIDMFLPQYDSLLISPLLPQAVSDTLFHAAWFRPRTATIFGSVASTGVFRFAPDSDAFPTLSLIPFEVHADNRDSAWLRIADALDSSDEYTLVMPDTTLTGLPKEEMEEYWRDVFADHNFIRTLGFSDFVYIEPIADNHTNRLQEVFLQNSNQLNAFTDALSAHPSPTALDQLFSDIVEERANNDEIAALQAIWETTKHDLYDGDDLNIQEERWIRDFVATTEDTVQSPDDGFRCLVTVTTNPSNGARITYYKSLLPESQAEMFGYSVASLKIERAMWTFVSSRSQQGEWIETGRVERVEIRPSNDVCNVIIEETIQIEGE
ncbi:MAG: hypothetical protein F4Y00_07670 [Bacteroidetes bacterium SB0662_bin_6]|nr:hypothetical protein [Bacteroidetes bacterium SB0662_bin_6]